MTEFTLVSLGEVASEVRDRLGSSETDQLIYGVEKGTGLKPGPRYQSADLSKYKAVRQGAFAYNPMRLNIGSIGFCSENMQEGFVSPDYVVFEFNQERVNPEFFNYHIKQRVWLDWLALSGEGSVRERIYFRKLEKYEFLLPSIEQQHAIVSVLRLLDDKIALNRRMSETLEAQARALFRDWFVDFGPVKAKMAGDAPYLSPDLWSLFPNCLDDDGVPEGWSYSTIGAEVDAVGGSTPSTKNIEFWDGDIAWTTPKDLSGLKSLVLLETSRRITSAGLAKISSGLLPKGTVLLSSRAPVGYLAITQIPLAVNQGYIAMRCGGRISNFFAFLWTKQNMDLILQNANGSTFLEISKKNFRPLPVIVADEHVHRQFDSMVKPFFEKIVANELESRTLAQTRDLLLPKLVSGEIRVGDVSSAELSAA